MHDQKLKIFKRPKNHEDGSDFDDFRTKKIAATQAAWWNKNRTIEKNEKFPKNAKNDRKQIRKSFKIDIADVINY